MENQTQTQNKKQICPICDKKFNPYNFIKHVVRNHILQKNLEKSEDGFFHCPFCNKYKSKYPFYTYKHIYNKHNQQTIQTEVQSQTIINFTKPQEQDGEQIAYKDWNNLIPILKQAYDRKLFVLILGPKGTGKTTLVRRFAQELGKKLFSINFSLRTKESHLIGSTVLKNGSTEFAMGLIPQSMREGGILYLDEVNTAEADVLVRLDEVLDDRREIVLKESGEPMPVKAHSDWFVIATVNPLSHAGTKELPPQLLSRFPVRIVLDYPPESIEREIIKMYSNVDGEDVEKAVNLANKLRQAAKVEDVQYSPSLRETIAFAKLLELGVEPKQAAGLVFANVYYQWGESEVQKVKDLIVSLWGE